MLPKQRGNLAYRQIATEGTRRTLQPLMDGIQPCMSSGHISTFQLIRKFIFIRQISDLYAWDCLNINYRTSELPVKQTGVCKEGIPRMTNERGWINAPIAQLLALTCYSDPDSWISRLFESKEIELSLKPDALDDTRRMIILGQLLYGQMQVDGKLCDTRMEISCGCKQGTCIFKFTRLLCAEQGHLASMTQSSQVCVHAHHSPNQPYFEGTSMPRQES